MQRSGAKRSSPKVRLPPLPHTHLISLTHPPFPSPPAHTHTDGCPLDPSYTGPQLPRRARTPRTSSASYVSFPTHPSAHQLTELAQPAIKILPFLRSIAAAARRAEELPVARVEAGGLPIGLVLASAPGSPALERTKSNGETGGASKHTRLHVIDCAICCEVLEVPVVKAGETDPAATGGVAGVFARRAYMVTPCRHIFHSACLEGWMRFRLQCPICREELPPL